VTENPAGYLTFTALSGSKINIADPSTGDSAVGDLGLYSNAAASMRSLSSIGISTGDWQEHGKINIDETTLKGAIEFDSDLVMNLFSRKSSVTGSTDLSPSDSAKRYKEEGAAYRMLDVIDQNVRTTRDNNGKKGLLLERAGIAGDASEYANTIYNEIYNYQTRLNDLIDKYNDKENALYTLYSQVETAIENMNTQSAWLAQQTGTGSS